MGNKKKPENFQISFDGLYSNSFQKFLFKLVQSVHLCHRLPKAKNSQNLITESWSKQRFSLIQEKVVIQVVCLRTQAVSI